MTVEPLPPMPSEADAAQAAWDRLCDQYRWYDAKAKTNQRWYKTLKLIELSLAATLPVVAGFDAPKLVTASFAAGIALLEGVQHLYQFHEKWISYRSVAEALEHERSLFRERVDRYSRADAAAVLGRTVERILLHEHSRWSSTETAALHDDQKDAGGDKS